MHPGQALELVSINETPLDIVCLLFFMNGCIGNRSVGRGLMDDRDSPAFNWIAFVF